MSTNAYNIAPPRRACHRIRSGNEMNVAGSSCNFASKVGRSGVPECRQNPYAANVFNVPANAESVDALVLIHPASSSTSPSASPSTPSRVYALPQVILEAITLHKTATPKRGRPQPQHIPLASKRLRSTETIWRSLSGDHEAQVLAAFHALADRNPYFVGFTLHPSDTFRSKVSGVQFLERARKLIGQNLRRHLGRDVDLIITYELTEKGEPHLHGIVAIHRPELKLLSKALKQSVGFWEADKAGKQLRLSRGKFNSNPDTGLARYISKDLDTHNFRAFRLSRSLVASAKEQAAESHARSFKELERNVEAKTQEIPASAVEAKTHEIPAPASTSAVEANPHEDLDAIFGDDFLDELESLDRASRGFCSAPAHTPGFAEEPAGSVSASDRSTPPGKAESQPAAFLESFDDYDLTPEQIEAIEQEFADLENFNEARLLAKFGISDG